MALPTPTPDSRVVITGASQGIGEALARDLARLGYNLVLVARREHVLQELANELAQAHGITADIYAVDLADAEARDRFIDYLSDIEVTMIVNSAGIASFGAFKDQDFTYERQEFRLNAEAVFELTHAVLPPMLKRGSGAILNVGSAAGNMPIPYNATYVMTKAGVNAFTEALHYELLGTGVTCTLLAPGPVREDNKPTDKRTVVDRVVPGWLWTSYADCSRETLEAVSAGRRRVVPGPLGKVMDVVSHYAPTQWISPLAGHFYKKMG